ncbi:hypothetical protein P879_10910 [Paragonimus westermani]|uniref:Uncharacterized protein n=1 Tax=Paragonimus westermani TaxID=34504 RepID=A0A8T0D649_9TREM|nr:hypothetical protein P879_10910 [Paragonimus westermani]
MRSTHHVLPSLTGGRTVNDKTLSNLLTEAEKRLIDRTITKLSYYPSLLAPNRLLMLRTNSPGSVLTTTTPGLKRWRRQTQHLKFSDPAGSKNTFLVYRKGGSGQHKFENLLLETRFW